MITGVFLSLQNITFSNSQSAMAQPVPLSWNTQNGLPLDIQLDLDKRLSHEPCIKDSVHIRDSVRIVEKTKWKVRYKNVAARTTARNEGKHLTAVTPDSMPANPSVISAPGREEQPGEVVGTPKVPSIQLTVDGEVVYSRNDNHSGVEGQH